MTRVLFDRQYKQPAYSDCLQPLVAAACNSLQQPAIACNCLQQMTHVLFDGQHRQAAWRLPATACNSLQLPATAMTRVLYHRQHNEAT
jgi:hypothetical protein